MLGTNGGGFFNANSAHPYENPSPFTNFVEMLSILVIPSGLTYMFGRCAGNTRQGWVLLSAMVVLFVLSMTVIYAAERAGNPNLVASGRRHGLLGGQSRRQHGGQGGPVRHRVERDLRQRDHRGLVRRRQRLARPA